MEFIDNFINSDENYLYHEEKDNIIRIEIHKYCKNKKLKSRTKYKVDTYNYVCNYCDNLLINPKKEYNYYGGILSSPEDFSFFCDNCNEINYRQNTMDDIYEEIKEGDTKFGKWKSTGEMIIIKDPSKYSYKSDIRFNESWRNKY